MNIKTSTLTGEKLAEWTARAQEWEKDRFGNWKFESKSGHTHLWKKESYRPDENGGQCFELIETFGLKIGQALWFWFGMSVEQLFDQKDKKEWICRAVVASVFGDEVGDEDH